MQTVKTCRDKVDRQNSRNGHRQTKHPNRQTEKVRQSMQIDKH